jgi:hypothetical protein
MILKASSRANGTDLATHLMRMDENDHVAILELRGFVAGNLHDAFAEAEAISQATKCKKYLFSLSLNPPKQAQPSNEDFLRAADQVEQKLGLTGQPRAIVFHEKEARRHAHVVWSRIDAQTMTAREMDFYKLKLRDVSRELYLEHGWEIPRGLTHSADRNPLNFTRGEWEQAKRLGQDPRWTKQVVQQCWKGSDNQTAFEHALKEQRMYLACGDRRGHVVVDMLGSVHSLPRALGLKTKEIRTRLPDPSALRSVADVQREIGETLTPAVHKHIEAGRTSFQNRMRPLDEQKEQVRTTQRNTRSALQSQHSLEQETLARDAQAKLPRGLRGLWDRITGRYQELRRENERAFDVLKKRQDDDQQRMIAAQLEERRLLQLRIDAARKRQAMQLLEMRADLARFQKYARLTPAPQLTTEHARARGLDPER